MGDKRDFSNEIDALKKRVAAFWDGVYARLVEMHVQTAKRLHEDTRQVEHPKDD